MGRCGSLTFLVSFDELVMCKDRLQVLEVCGVIHRNFLVVNKLNFEMSNPFVPRSQPRKASFFNKYFHGIPTATRHSADIEKCSGIGSPSRCGHCSCVLWLHYGVSLDM